MLVGFHPQGPSTAATTPARTSGHVTSGLAVAHLFGTYELGPPRTTTSWPCSARSEPGDFRATAVGGQPYDEIHGNDEHEQGHPRRDPTRPRAFRGALTTFRAGDSERARQLGVAWENFDKQLTDHHEGEHEIAWPALEQVGVTRETLDQMDAEHAAMAEALGNARSAMAALVSNPGPASPRPHWQPSAAQGRHRDPPRPRGAEIEPIYLEQHDSPAIKEMGKQFAKAGPPRPARSWPGSATAARPT